MNISTAPVWFVDVVNADIVSGWVVSDPASRLTALTRFAPGSKLPDHEHTELEQSYVLEGSLEDDEGIATAGNYVWRPAI